MLDVKIMNCNIKRPKKPTFTATEIWNRAKDLLIKFERRKNNV